MFMESQFVNGLLFFAIVALAMEAEDYLAAHVFGKGSPCHRLVTRFERRHPKLCDNDDTFYSFFRRDTFQKNNSQ